MSVLDDILGFFRDLVRGNTQESDARRTLTDEDIPAVQRAIDGALGGLQFGSTGLFSATVGDLVGRLRTAVRGSEASVGGFQGTISQWIASELDPILALASVERSGPEGPGFEATLESELQIFENDSARARNGAVLATGLVTALNITAAVLDQAEQVLTLGQIEGAQQLIQNIIWSTGLADLGGLSFRSQVATSSGPLLQRHWNSVAQAEIPTISDLVRFQLREVFQPEQRQELLGGDDITPFKAWARQRGYSDYWADSYWAAHWNLPSTTQLNEMVHRGTISEDEWRKQVRLNDYVPYAIDWLGDIIYSPFTRVDARRMADMGLLSDEELLQSYADIGYYAPKSADNNGRFAARFVDELEFDATVHKAQALVIFTRVFNALPDIRRRLSNGFLKPDEVQPHIRNLGVPDATADRLTETLVKATDLGQAEAVRELTTAQIVRGVKEGLISFAQGLFLLIQLGWDSSRAEFMLRLRVSTEEAVIESTELGRRLTNGNV